MRGSPISILHLSDLHRDLKNPIGTPALVNSLLHDITGAVDEEPSIPMPDIVIVSGDVIQGTHKDDKDFEKVLRDQYDIAEDFLSQIAQELLGGDRSKIIIVPGNHDIDFPTAFSALEEIDFATKNEDERADLTEILFSKETPFRWWWSGFKLYRISDDEKYNQRFKQFCDFYQRFYGNRTYSINPAEQFDIFDYPDLGILILGLNSCYRNDPWNRKGAVHPEALSNACLQLRQREYRGRLRFGVWHHSTRGGPNDDDYLDSDFLQQLILNGISLGFHGHQHRAEFLDERYVFGGQKKINVVSSSTLCGGERVLMSGHPRGYNRVIIQDDMVKTQLHLRKMANQDFQAPIWSKNSLFDDSAMKEFELQRFVDPLMAKYDLEDIAAAERLIREGKNDEAIELLTPLADAHENASDLLKAIQGKVK